MNVFNSATSPRVLSYRYVLPVGFNLRIYPKPTLRLLLKTCNNILINASEYIKDHTFELRGKI